ncbi:MAG: sigma-54-dependent Fis family transcriptional regulator [Acidobacteria bacterium]|nr:sigma-54-dependent Fis family transcriptional regulator [Acidobacteriota bacterium]
MVETTKTILLIDDDDVLRRILTHHLEEAGYRVLSEARGGPALGIFTTTEVDLVITDIQMPEMDGYELLKRIRAISPEAPVIVITAFGSIDSAVHAMKLGAEDYITKPFNKEELLLNAAKALERSRLIRENRYLRRFIDEHFALENIVGTSKRMQDLYGIVEKVARTDVTVLLLGESGTGKELLAKAIHQNSPRRDQSFVAINCAAIPEGLMESEFFGHKKGSFTGAHTNAKGKLEVADGGTVFLDEIGELPLPMQAKLLRVLQEGEIMQVGEATSRRVDLRFIAATTRDLARMVEDGTFREEFYFRLNVVPIKLPPLRERREDIPLLADYFLKQAAQRFGRPEIRFDKEIFSYFQNYLWPGNVRELKNTVERMVVLASADRLTVEDLPDEIRRPGKAVANALIDLPETGVDLEAIEQEIVREALERNDWNQTAAAKYLNITRSMLISRMQKYGLEKPQPVES